MDAVPLSFCKLADGITPVATDQRGIPRPQGPACDIGAYEYQTTAQAAQTLLNSVQSMGLPQGTQQALSASLQAAVNSLNAGNTNAAINQLQAFLNQVSAFQGDGKLTAEQAAQLTAAVQQILQRLGA
jgi:hypothetical protein